MEMRVSSLAGLAALAVGQANSSQAQKGRESILICGGAQPASEPVLRRGLTDFKGLWGQQSRLPGHL